MFHFPTFPPLTLCVQVRVTGHDSSRVSPFGYPRIKVWLATPRGFSQPPTSFIGSWCQGIHRAPLITWPQRCSRPLCSSQDAGGPGPRAAYLPHRGSFAQQTGPSPPVPPAEPVRRAGCRRTERDARSLRTQQRAKPAALPTRRSEPPRRPYWNGWARTPGQLVNVPPLSYHRGTNALDMALDSTGMTGRARCSLERR